MTERDVLVKARALIEKPENWGQGAYSQATGKGCAYCARGAVLYGADELNETGSKVTEALQLLYAGTGRHGYGSLIEWNDDPERTHADVIQAFDRAIALAGGDGGKL